MKILIKRDNKIIGSYINKSTAGFALKLLGYGINEIEMTLNSIRSDEETSIEVE